MFVTGPPTHSVGGRTSDGHWRLSSSVTLHGGPKGGFTRASQAMTSYRLRSNYNSTDARRARLGPVRATCCFY